MHFGSFHHGLIQSATTLTDRHHGIYGWRIYNGQSYPSIYPETLGMNTEIKNRQEEIPSAYSDSHGMKAEKSDIDISVAGDDSGNKSWVSYFKYFAIGILFGILLVKSEVV